MMKLPEFPGLIRINDKGSAKALRKVLAVSKRVRAEAKKEIEEAHQMMRKDKRQIFAL